AHSFARGSDSVTRGGNPRRRNHQQTARLSQTDGLVLEASQRPSRPHFVHGNRDRKSTRLNSSHEWISYAVFCLKKKKRITDSTSSSSSAHTKLISITTKRPRETWKAADSWCSEPRVGATSRAIH